MISRRENQLIIVANAGRSGSTYLWNLLNANKVAPSIFHENIPVQVSKPRYYNRAYCEQSRKRALGDEDLKRYLNHWSDLLREDDVIETGWTAYHLLPILRETFPGYLKVIVLHRDPWSVALSRANMGNYHPRTWYDDSHEISPFDANSIAPNFAQRWEGMNHAEKCLYWWYVIHREIDEFLNSSPEVPRLEIEAASLFDGTSIDNLSHFIGKPLQKKPDLERNPVQQFMLETFPIRDEHLAFASHAEINFYAEQRFGQKFYSDLVMRQAKKYQLPDGTMPRIRHSLDYWSRRRRVGSLVRSFLNKSRSVGNA